MKIWCSTCEGTGELDAFGYDVCDCQECNGKGYTENETIEHEARVGRATIKWFNSGRTVESFGIEIWSPRGLVEWAENEVE